MSTWSPIIPEQARDWPRPRRMRRTMRWLNSEDEYRAHFQQIIDAEGEDALATVIMSGKPALNPSPTRFFCAGLVMLHTGRVSREKPYWTEYLVPARAALEALGAGLVICKGQPPNHDTPGTT